MLAQKVTVTQGQVIGGVIGAGLIIAASAIGYSILTASGAPVNLALTSPIFYRPVFARVRSFGVSSLPTSSTIDAAATNIASLVPSFWTGGVRFEGPTSAYTAGYVSELTPEIVSDYSTVQQAILAVNPSAYSDVWLRATQYDDYQGSGDTIVQDMKALVASDLSFQAFSFDSWSSMSPQAIQAALAYAHSVGKLAGGQVGGAPVAADYLFGADQYDFTTFTDTIPYTSQFIASLGVPFIMSIDDGPTPVTPTGGPLPPGITFHAWFADTATNEGQQYSTFDQRLEVVETGVNNQKIGYAYAMNPLFPTGQVGPPSIMYDASADVNPNGGTMLDVMQALVVANNPRP